MEILLQNLILLISAAVLVTVFAALACRTRFSLWFTIPEGAVTLFVFCFLMREGASMEEILLALLVLLTPSLLFKAKKGRDEE